MKMDHTKKKPTKAETQNAEQEILELEERKKFFEDFNIFQKEKGKSLAAVVVHDLKGSHVEFTVVPYQEPK